ncbi:DUF6531 domain-containing protein [Actinopolymorpha pittospori]
MTSSGIPGETSWGPVDWELVSGTPSQGCKTELYRASDNQLVDSVQSTGGACSSGYFSTFYGDPLVSGTKYYPKLYNYAGGTWKLLFDEPSFAFAAGSRPGLTGGLELGPCDCGTSTGLQLTYQQFVDDPVSTATGALTEQVQDAMMSAPGASFDLTRTYTSSDSSVGLLGKGWAFPYEASLKIESGKVTYRAEDGQQIAYVKNADGTFATPAGVTSKLASISGGYRLSTKSHEALTFDSTGRLTAWKDTSGQGLTFTYSSSLLSKITDAGGREATVTMSGGKVSRVTLPDGRYVAYTYTGDLLTSIRDLRGGTTSYEYDDGRLARIKDQKQRLITNNVYDTAGRVIRQTDAFGKMTTYQYDVPAKGDTTRTDPRAGKWTYTYRGNVLMRVIDPLGHFTDYSYDAQLRQTGITDALGRTTSMSYDAAGNMVSRTAPEPLGYSESWTYDAADNLRSYNDRNGAKTTYEYDSANRLIKTIDPVNGTAKPTLVTYTAKGQQETVTSAGGHVTTFSYDAQGNQTSVKSPLGKITTFTYDATGRMLTETDPRGMATQDPDDFTTSYGYDDADHVTSVTDARDSTTQFAFDEVGDPVRVTDPRGKVTTFGYDAAHRPTSQQAPGLPAATWGYDENGNLKAETDPTGALTTYDYDSANRKVHMFTARANVEGATDPSKYEWKYFYDSANNLTKVQDPLGNGTITRYDELNRPYRTEDPLGHATTTSYDGVGNVTAVTDQLNHSTRYEYDDLGRLQYSYDARNNKTTYSYDADSNQTAATTPLGFKTSYGYDDDGNQTSMVDPRGNVSGADPAQYTTTYGYDEADNQTSATDPLGNETVTSYDPVNNVSKVTDALEHATSYTYDEKDRLIKVVGPDDADGDGSVYGYDDVDNLISRKDPNGNTTTYGYDAMGQVKETVDPLGRKVTHTYDPEGNLSQSVTARGNVLGADSKPWTLDYEYDARNLRTAIKSPDTGVDATMVYDNAGRQFTTTGSGGTITLGWDDADRLISTNRGSVGFSYDYDNDGHVTSRTYPDGTVITAGFDADGRQMSSTRAGVVVTMTYDQADNLRGIFTPATTSYNEARGYDRAGQLITVTAVKGTEKLNRFDITRDAVGNPTQIKSTRGATATYEAYEYDTADRLTKVCYSASCTDASKSIGYSYDKVGNRLTQNRIGVTQPGTSTYAYNDGDELDSISAGGSTVDYSYDADGNLAKAGAANYTFDVTNHLRKMTDGTKTVTLSYDGDGGRIGISTTAQTGRVLFRDTNNPVPMLAVQAQGTSRTALRYTDSGIPLESIWEQTVGTVTDTAWLYHDPIGSIVDTTSAEGVPQTTTGYEPFGAASTQDLVDDPIDTVLGFTGERLDPSLGLIDLRARDYDPATGRFTAEDPAISSINDPYVSPYAYVENRPLYLIDPDGERPYEPESGKGSTVAHDLAVLLAGYILSGSADDVYADLSDSYGDSKNRLSATQVRGKGAQWPDIATRKGNRNYVYEVKPWSTYGRSASSRRQLTGYLNSLRQGNSLPSKWASPNWYRGNVNISTISAYCPGLGAEITVFTDPRPKYQGFIFYMYRTLTPLEQGLLLARDGNTAGQIERGMERLQLSSEGAPPRELPRGGRSSY